MKTARFLLALLSGITLSQGLGHAQTASSASKQAVPENPSQPDKGLPGPRLGTNPQASEAVRKAPGGTRAEGNVSDEIQRAEASREPLVEKVPNHELSKSPSGGGGVNHSTPLPGSHPDLAVRRLNVRSTPRAAAKAPRTPSSGGALKKGTDAAPKAVPSLASATPLSTPSLTLARSKNLGPSAIGEWRGSGPKNTAAIIGTGMRRKP